MQRQRSGKFALFFRLQTVNVCQLLGKGIGGILAAGLMLYFQLAKGNLLFACKEDTFIQCQLHGAIQECECAGLAGETGAANGYQAFLT